MSDPYPPTRVVIAGGGTAGWLAATALVRQLGPLVDVTLIESDEIGTVGVGESTIPTARSFHAFLGIDEAAFMRATQATFKLGIAFENWGADGARYFHPFGTVGRSVAIADFQHFWLEARRHGFGGAYTDHSLETRAAEANRFGRDEAGTLAYAYHLDATAYARFLRGIAEPAGVRRIEGRITKIERHGEGGEARRRQHGAGRARELAPGLGQRIRRRRAGGAVIVAPAPVLEVVVGREQHRRAAIDRRVDEAVLGGGIAPRMDEACGRAEAGGIAGRGVRHGNPYAGRAVALQPQPRLCNGVKRKPLTGPADPLQCAGMINGLPASSTPHPTRSPHPEVTPHSDGLEGDLQVA